MGGCASRPDNAATHKVYNSMHSEDRKALCKPHVYALNVERRARGRLTTKVIVRVCMLQGTVYIDNGRDWITHWMTDLMTGCFVHWPVYSQHYTVAVKPQNVTRRVFYFRYMPDGLIAEVVGPTSAPPAARPSATWSV